MNVEVAYDKTEIANATQEARAELEHARKASIASDDDFLQWAEDAKTVARQIKATKAAKATVLQPLQAAVNAINALFKPREDAEAQLDSRIRTELERWGLFKKAEQRKQLAAAAAAANKGDTEGMSTALSKVSELAPVKGTGVSVKEVWTAVVVAPELVPREWCTPDVKAIAKHAKDTQPARQPAPIAGVRFELVGSSTVRSKL